jgi:methyl-accepting chemotaxis protein
MGDFSTVIEDEFNTINTTVEETALLTEYMIGVCVFLALLIAAFSWISSSRKVVRPINNMTKAMESLAANRLDMEIPYLGQKDEVGGMAEALQVFKKNAIDTQRLRDEQKALEERATKDKRAMLNNLANGFEQGVQGMITSIASASSQLSQTAEAMSKVADDTNKKSVDVASASEQASHNVQSVASAAEEMAATVQEISKQISLSNNVVNDAREKAEIADNSSKELVEMSKSVGAIATLIEDIAGQINLLALNATIESARSGEAGKGFAVVANEVKNLATQTAKATEQIRQQLEAVQNTAAGVAGSLGQVREAIAKVSEGSAAIAAAVEEQSAATQEIVSNMNTATQGVEQINGGIFAIKGGTNSTTDATRQVLEAARTLSGQATQMDKEVKTFLQNLLAA